jgi:hypothetical protein
MNFRIKTYINFAFLCVFTLNIAVFADPNGLPGLEYAGIYQLHNSDPNLITQDITIATVCRSKTYIGDQPQMDYLVNIGHKCLLDKNIQFADGIQFAKGFSDHATAIGGILTGSDPNGYHPEIGNFNYQGVIPDAKLDVYEFWRFISTYMYGGKEFDADVVTMSVGNIFSQWWTRAIERAVQRDGLIVTAGVGNGSDVFEPLLYPAGSPNVIGVGVMDSTEGFFNTPISAHSSMGPTVDNRCGVDIVAPGSFLVPDANSIGGYSLTDDWTSFATPVVSGTIGMLMQKAKSDPNLILASSKTGGNCVMRAIIMNSAKKLPSWHKGEETPDDDHEFPLDFLQGAGAIDALNAYKHLTSGRGGELAGGNTGWDNNKIERIARTENIYQLTAKNGEMITATLVWNRHYENDYPYNATPDADTDLALELWGIGADGTRELIDYSDSTYDNIEHIHHQAYAKYISYDLVVKVSGAGKLEVELEGYGLAFSVL